MNMFVGASALALAAGLSSPAALARGHPAVTATFPCRRDLVRQVTAAALPRVAIAASAEPVATRWQPTGDTSKAESYYTILKAGETELRNLLAEWEERTITKTGAYDGDAVRRASGTGGVGSPLFGSDKILKTVGLALDARDARRLAQLCPGEERHCAALLHATSVHASETHAAFAPDAHAAHERLLRAIWRAMRPRREPFARKGEAWWQVCLNTEFGGMNEVAYSLYQLTRLCTNPRVSPGSSYV